MKEQHPIDWPAFATSIAIIALVRVLNNYLPDAWVGEDHVWVVHLLLAP